MYRIRFHGRGGQGIKTAAQILGTAFFLEGFETQDAPRYGAERRGAPIFAYVRAARTPIQERGVIDRPDLVIVADETLVPVPTAGVLQGLAGNTVLLIHTREPPQAWKVRLGLASPVFSLPVVDATQDAVDGSYIGAMCAGAAARLVGAIRRERLEQAIREEIAKFGAVAVEKNLAPALAAFAAMAEHAGVVQEGGDIRADRYATPAWVDVPLERARIAAPDIHAAATSALVNTGVWRTLRPVIDHERCNRCSWICSTLCPDSAIAVGPDRAPSIDYDHCKGCLICVAVCPPHAIRAVSEPRGLAKDG